MLIGIVLGHRLNDDGTMTEILKSRLDTACIADEKLHPDRWILSGGVANSKAQTSEASVMHDYLASKGITREKLLLEDRSRNTQVNARRSMKMARDLSVTHILLVTSPKHLTRWYLNPIRLFAKEIGRDPITLMSFTVSSGEGDPRGSNRRT